MPLDNFVYSEFNSFILVVFEANSDCIDLMEELKPSAAFLAFSALLAKLLNAVTVSPMIYPIAQFTAILPNADLASLTKSENWEVALPLAIIHC